jgi:signal transduction histidine kinase
MTTYSAQQYFQERNQVLHRDLADHIKKEVEPFMYNGEPIPEKLDEILHHMMAINPSIEVYILDSMGSIVEYVAPYKEVKLARVDLQPVREFVGGNPDRIIKGDDPRNPGKRKVFSAAAHQNDMTGRTDGYVYVILASEEYQSAASVLFGSFILKVGIRTLTLTLFGALVIGLLMIWLLTRNLREIIRSVERFSQGDHESRINIHKAGELSVLANTYNRMADTIEANIEELKSTERLRRELIANISHDLRTPLAVIHGYLETMIMKEEDHSLSPDDRKKYFGIVLKNTERLKRLVSELFELSKLEARQVKPQMEPFFLQELMMDTYNRYKILAERKGIHLKAEIDKSLPLVAADLGMIERVLQNLLDNALKFTNEGDDIEIAVSKADEGHVEVVIKDTGIGISEEASKEVFSRYKKYEATTHNKEGMGLGLAIVKKILELHQSDIQLVSNLHKGSLFRFRLPVA